MKNFDTDREERRRAALEAERGFQIGGETFLRAIEVKPDSLAPMDRMRPAKRDATGKVIEAGSGIGEDVAAIDEVILAMIDPVDGSHERYLALRARDEDILTLEDLRALSEWLLEQTTLRPTLPPSPSTQPPVTAGT